jgi:hypothetical protein
MQATSDAIQKLTVESQKLTVESKKTNDAIQKESKKTNDAIQKLTAETQKLERFMMESQQRFDSFISSQARANEGNVTEVAQNAIRLMTKKPCIDMVYEEPQLSTKLYDQDGVCILEWDGLLYSPHRQTLFCIEAKTFVCEQDVKDLVKRLKDMRRYIDTVREVSRRGLKRSKDKKRFGKQAVKIAEFLKLREMEEDKPKVVGILGFARSSKGPIAKRAKETGIYLLLKDSGTLVAPDDGLLLE